MHNRRYVGVSTFVMALALGCYFGAYFLAADYIDVGDNSPLYLMQYRVGSTSLHSLAPFFEPARQIDELCLRRKGAAMVVP